jgi:hypothetical protein
MAYTNRPFNYTGTLPNQVQNDLGLANDNFEILGQAFVNNDPTTSIAKNSDKVDGYHASQTPQANTIPVAKSDGKIDANWLPVTSGNFYKVTFATSGNWTVPNNVKIIWVTGTAAGGGGGGGWVSDSGYYYGGGGGGSGSACVNVPIWVTPGETLSITIGADGSGGSPGTAGGNGGSTIITGSVSGTLLTLQGGNGGASSGGNGSGGNGGGIGGGTGGSIGGSTGDGGAGSPFCLVGAGGGKYLENGGLFLGRFLGGNSGSGSGGGGGGGASFYGAGGNGGNGSSSSGSNGANGQGYGAGGGGGGSRSSARYSGGNGGSGYIEIIYFV